MSESAEKQLATQEIIRRRGLPEKSGRLPGAVGKETPGILETIQGETSGIRTKKQGEAERAQSDQQEKAACQVQVAGYCKNGRETTAKAFDIRIL